jgi:hypothetical protein
MFLPNFKRNRHGKPGSVLSVEELAKAGSP